MIDKPLLAAVMTLLTLSLIMDYSLSIYTVSYFGFSDFHFVLRQGIAVVLGFIIMVILTKFNPDVWITRIGMLIFFIFSILMIAMPFLPASLVNEVGGAKRWVQLGPMSIAPVEFFKIGFVFFLSWSFSRKFNSNMNLKYLQEIKLFSPYLIVFLFAVVLIAIFQKDLGQVVVLGATLMVLILLIGSSYKFIFTLLFLSFTAIASLIFMAPHRIARIKSWWSTVQNNILSMFPNSEVAKSFHVATTSKEPYQISNSLNSIHNGGLFGQGLGNGQFKLGYLSEVHTDFILAGITEELGFLGLVAVTGIILFIIFRIFKIASKVENQMFYLFSISVALLIAFSFILNSYGISGITPIKGIAVPFLSYGGSHILASCIAIGMVLMISKKMPRDAEGNIL